MDYDIFPPDRDGIMLVRVWGEIDYFSGIQARIAVVKEAEECGCTQFMVDFRKARINGPIYQFVEYYADIARHYPIGSKIGLIVGQDTMDDLEKNMELARVVSKTGGMQLKDFLDEPPAREWLLKS